MTAPTLTDEWRAGTRKVIRIGDTVRVDPHARRGVRGTWRFRVKAIHVHPDRVEISVFGGKPLREAFHAFAPEELHVCRGIDR